MRTLARRAPEIGIVLLVFIILAALLLPVPSFVLDLLLTLSVTLSVVVLLTAIYTSDPLQFSAFPSVLLLLTLLRVGLNAASTKLILVDGDAGKLIEAFGNFVVGGNLAVGVVVFLIVCIVNFIVITKGAGRVAEVQARFTLDAMPAKQMSIDADLSKGVIDDEEAKSRRARLQQEMDLYGAMDGAAKFTRGEAIAGIIITALNIIGGLYVGMMQRDMSATDAINLYSRLTIGDGLISQIPAIIVSTAAGILVTQSAGSMHLGEAVFQQMTRHARALWGAAIILGAFALIPGLPFVPFALLAGGVGFLASKAGVREKTEDALRVEKEEAVERERVAAAEAGPNANPLARALQTHEVEVHLGLTLVELANAEAGGDLVSRMPAVREAIGSEFGILVPAVYFRDNLQLAPNTYAIRIRGVEVASGEAFPKAYLAIDTGMVSESIQGFKATTEPGYKQPAQWISRDQKAEAESKGYLVVQPATVIATHLQEVLRSHAADLLGRQEVQEMIGHIKSSHPAVVKDVIPEKVSLGTVHNVLRALLREGVPVRDMVTILESLSDAADHQIRELPMQVDFVRRSLAKLIASLYRRDSGAVEVILLAPRLEAALMRTLTGSAAKPGEEVVSSSDLTALFDALVAFAERHRKDGRVPPLMTSPALRAQLRDLIEPYVPSMGVITIHELPNQMPVHTVATWDLPQATKSAPVGAGAA